MAETEGSLETVSLEIFLIIAMESPMQVVLNTERNFIVDYITKKYPERRLKFWDGFIRTSATFLGNSLVLTSSVDALHPQAAPLLVAK